MEGTEMKNKGSKRWQGMGRDDKKYKGWKGVGRDEVIRDRKGRMIRDRKGWGWQGMKRNIRDGKEWEGMGINTRTGGGSENHTVWRGGAYNPPHRSQLL